MLGLTVEIHKFYYFRIIGNYIYYAEVLMGNPINYIIGHTVNRSKHNDNNIFQRKSRNIQSHLHSKCGNTYIYARTHAYNKELQLSVRY